MKKPLLLSFLTLLLAGALPLAAQTTDWRDLQNGFETPDENYADQPYFVVLEDGKWLLTVTTGPGAEGSSGQHVVSTTSTDNGQTWTPLVDIEATGSALPAPDTGVLSSWVVPYQSGYRAPAATYNRVYAIYTWGSPYVTSPPVSRRDTFGPYAFRYTDDGGATWSARHIIPYTNTDKDNSNYFSGVTPAGWNTDKPLRLNGKMFLAFTKISAPFGAPGGIQQGEGYIYRCDNIDTEGDPTALDWKMLPGTVNPDNSVDTAAKGIRELAWGGEQEEFDLQDLTSGALLNTFRTTRGWIGEAMSTDEGRTWTEPVKRRYHLDGRVVRHNRANCKVWKLNSGKYLMWHHNNGGTSYFNRNPVWVSIGTQAGNAISWGEPEVLLYHRDKAKLMSYPDMNEVGGAMYVTETEKGISRVHPIDAGFLSILDTQPSRSTKTTADLQLEQTGTLAASYTMPTLPDLSGYAPKGFTIEARFQTSNLNAGQTIFDSFSGGSGVRMTVSSVGAVNFEMSDGTNSITLRSDTGTVVAGQPAHISVHVDAPAKLITIVVNGKVGDGTNFNTGNGDRTFGWAHFANAFGDVNGGNIAVGSGLNGSVDILRVYDRSLMHTEAIANFRNASGVSGPAVTAGIIVSDNIGESGQALTFDASHSDVSELTTPVYTWDFGDGSPAVQGASVNHSFASAGNYTVTLTISEVGTPSLQGDPVATLDFAVVDPSADAVISASGSFGSTTVTLSAASSTLTNLPDPVYTWDFGDGSSDTGLTVEHTYASLRDYTITLTISRSGAGSLGGSPVATKVLSVGASGELLAYSHDGSSSDENSPFDTNILDNGTDWTYSTDGTRSVMSALDNATSGNNRLILIGADGVTEFSTDGGPAGKGWVFEIELELLQGQASTGGVPFAMFGVRSENGAGRQAWIGLSNDGGTGGLGQIGFMNSSAVFSGAAADLDVDSLIGDGQYHNFKIHKYDNAGTTTLDVFMDGALVLSRAYSSLDADIDIADIQGFVSGTPVPLSEPRVDFINFTLYNNLAESAPGYDGSAPTLQSTSPGDGDSGVAPSANLVANFDESIALGTSGDVTIKNLTNPSDIVISLGGSDPDGTLTLTGANQLTIDPAVDLAAGDEYAVQIGSTVVEDSSGNSFAGISDTTTWSFTLAADTPGPVLVDLNADGTARNATVGEFEDAIGLSAGTFSGSTVTIIDFNDSGNAEPPTTTIRTGSAGSITFSASSANFTLGGDADGWFGGDTSPNNLLEDGVFMRSTSQEPSGIITLSGSGLGLAADRTYELYLFAGRSLGHGTSFTFDVNAPTDPSAGTSLAAGVPVISGDETLGTVKFTFATGAIVPSSLVIGWGGQQNVDGSQDAVFSGFALRDVGAAGTTTFTVSYNGNGSDGGFPPEDVSNPYDVGSTVTVLGNTRSLTRTGFSFGGWNTESNGSDTAYSAGDTFTISGNVTLYAHWIAAETFAEWISKPAYNIYPVDQDFTADADGDGLSNGVEGFFGTDPAAFDTGLTEISMSGNTVSFRHPNPSMPLADVSGDYQWSLDLLTWYAADGLEGNGNTTVIAVATPNSPSGNTTSVQATISGTVPTRLFFRVVVSVAGDPSLPDFRNIETGFIIPDEVWGEQPLIVKLADGRWFCVLTTANGPEGSSSQHIVYTLSSDQGRTWLPLRDIEPASGPEASSACPFIVPSGPASERIYVFYVYNADDVRQVPTVTGGTRSRVDLLGEYAFRYTDDYGETWSDRFYLPYRKTSADLNNGTGGDIQMFWPNDKPMLNDAGELYFGFGKIGGHGGTYYWTNTEGWMWRCDNILEETDVTQLTWTMLPDGDEGLLAPAGPISEETMSTVLSDGSLYAVTRTVQGHPAEFYSRDRGQTWTAPAYMTYASDGRKIPHPRANSPVWKLSNGKYLFWFHNHSGTSFSNRNPAWVAGGIEVDSPDGKILKWSEPEILLYTDAGLTNVGITYPDLTEDGGDVYVSESQESIVRVHKIEQELLDGLWGQFDAVQTATEEGLVSSFSAVELSSPAAKPLAGVTNFASGGATIDFKLTLPTLQQTVLLSNAGGGDGWTVSVDAQGVLSFNMLDGAASFSWSSDAGLISAGESQHVTLVMDSRSGIFFAVVDGIFCDSSNNPARQFGWGRYDGINSIDGTGELTGDLARIEAFRLYDRALTTSEAIGNFRAGL